MATLQEKVDAALAKKGMSATELGGALGYKHGYQGYYAIFVSKKTAFTAQRKARVAQILGVDPTYFDEGDNEVAKRERVTRQEFEHFLRDPVARMAEDHIIRTLERMAFAGGRVPTRQLYRMLALVLMGHWTDQEVANALKLNGELDKLPPLPDPPPSKKRRGKAKPAKQ
jgi:transcriptional regulator with XRE-family HTH domain